MNKPPTVETKNIVLAVVLSMIIMFGWQYYYQGPAIQKAEEQAKVELSKPAAEAAVPLQNRDTLIAASPRVKIETDQFSGSINLAGAQLDDLKLLKHTVDANPASGAVTLLSPSGAPNAFYVEQGIVAQQAGAVVVPDSKTLWTAPAGAILTLDKPLTLTWNNGSGLAFERMISISDDYLFTVKQTVTNTSAAAVNLLPYGRVQRQDTPVIAGYWVFFEGMLGVHNGGLNENH